MTVTNLSKINNNEKLLFFTEPIPWNNITGSNNCTAAMESLTHAVDNTYNLCCPIKSKTLSNKDLKRPWISHEIISNTKKGHSFALYYENKIPKIFILIPEILSMGKLDGQRRIIMSINSMLQKMI